MNNHPNLQNRQDNNDNMLYAQNKEDNNSISSKNSSNNCPLISYNHNCNDSSNIQSNQYDGHININQNQQNSNDNTGRLIQDKNNKDNSQHMNNNTTSQVNNLITTDITTEDNWSTQWQLEPPHDIDYAPQAHTLSQPTINLYLTGSDTSYTGMGANQIEDLAGPAVEQGPYPQEAATRVTPAQTDLLTTPQSGGQEPRIGHGSSTEQPQELSASQREHADADDMQLNERMAQTTHSARKRKKCSTAAEEHCDQSRHMESTQTVTEVQAPWEMYSHRTIVTQSLRSTQTSGKIQHQGQVQPRKTLMARERGSTGYSPEVLETGKMATTLQQAQTTASITTTQRRVKAKKEEDGPQRLPLKHGGSGGIGGVG
jgi:hypothetical protein